MPTATMNQFVFTAKDKTGKIVKGQLEADHVTTVRDKLLSMGAIPLEISPANTGMQREIRIGPPKRVKMKDLAIFARQFSTMLSSGLPMLRALSVLAEQSENEELRKVLRSVRADVEGGASLSRALENHPKVFPPLMVNMTRAGEAGGFIDRAMVELAVTLEADVKLRGEIKAAMAYPMVVFVLAIIMVIVMLIFIVPTFASMFATLGGTLPLPTRMLVTASNILKATSPVLIVGLIAAWIAWRKNSHKPAVRAVVDPAKLRIPIFGKLFQKVALARFSRNLGTLLHSGVPILTSFDIVADTTGSIVIARAIRDVQESVKKGDSITQPLTEHPVFPPMVTAMIGVGEESGAIDEMLHKIAEFYQEQVEQATKALTSLIEPLMIAFLGVVVGAMIIALYLPIFNIYNLINN